MGWTAWTATTHKVESWDFEWLLGHFQSNASGQTRHFMINKSLLNVGLADDSYLSAMPRSYVDQQVQALSKPPGTARIQSFITFEFLDEAQLTNVDPKPIEERLLEDSLQAWQKSLGITLHAAIEGAWRCLMCIPDESSNTLAVRQFG